jgi:hypothetical protein
MKKIGICLSIAAGFLYCMAHSLWAQGPKTGSDKHALPIVPISVELRHVSEFFRQDLGQDSRYSSITAFVDNARNPPWYEIILRERASGTQVYYSNSKPTVGALTNEGDEAYYSNILYQSSSDSHSDPAFQVQFQDKSGQPIQWNFKAGPPSGGPSPKAQFLDRPDDHGLVLLRLNGARRAAIGTAVVVGDSSYPSRDDALFSEDILLARIEPTTDNWTVTQAPVQWSVGSQWGLHDSSGQQRQIKIQKISGGEISLRVQDTLDPNSAPMLVDAQQLDGQLRVRSLTARNRMDTLKISFDPALPLPASVPPDKNQVQFTIDENDRQGVASGLLTATRGLGDEHLTWHFSSPEWARSLTFDTGVNITVSSEGLGHEKPRGSM